MVYTMSSYKKAIAGNGEYRRNTSSALNPPIWKRGISKWKMALLI